MKVLMINVVCGIRSTGRICTDLAIALAKSRTVDPEKTKICCTRYGNVMCSRGSVIPLWIEQIKAGNPITITEPSMTRFIMSLEEAVDLVLFAFKNGTSGDILEV